MIERPKVGVGVVVLNNEKILLGRRTGKHGMHEWSPPGGHLEMFESWTECAKRETMEEAGISLDDIQYLWTTNDIFTKTSKHYVTIVMLAKSYEGEISIIDGEALDSWGWFGLEDLPESLFLPFKNFLTSGGKELIKNNF